MKWLVSAVSAALAVVSLTACATEPVAADSGSRRAALYRAHAGAPIDGFLGRINDWTLLDEHSLVVWTGPNRAYLLEVMGPCNELPWVQRITFSSGGNRRLHVFDDVLVLGRQPQPQSCPIREIRPVDAKAVKRAQKAEREAREGAGQAQFPPRDQ